MWQISWRLLSSRAGLAVVLGALLWGWHLQDKRAALLAARDGFVRRIELTAAQAELEGLRRRMASIREANQALHDKIQVAQGDARRIAAELEAYERDTKINPEGVVDPDLLRRLRAN